MRGTDQSTEIMLKREDALRTFERNVGLSKMLPSNMATWQWLSMAIRAIRHPSTNYPWRLSFVQPSWAVRLGPLSIAWVEIRPFSGLWCVYELATFLRHGQAQQVKLFPVAMARVLLVIASSSVPVTWIQLILAIETAPAKLGFWGENPGWFQLHFGIFRYLRGCRPICLYLAGATADSLPVVGCDGRRPEPRETVQGILHPKVPMFLLHQWSSTSWHRWDIDVRPEVRLWSCQNLVCSGGWWRQWRFNTFWEIRPSRANQLA